MKNLLALNSENLIEVVYDGDTRYDLVFQVESEKIIVKAVLDEEDHAKAMADEYFFDDEEVLARAVKAADERGCVDWE